MLHAGFEAPITHRHGLEQVGPGHTAASLDWQPAWLTQVSCATRVATGIMLPAAATDSHEVMSS